MCGARRGRIRGGRIRGGASEAVEPVYDNHPRFHPVPIEPVFSPRTDLTPEAGLPQDDCLPATPSAEEPPTADAPPSTEEPSSAEELPPINILPPTVAPEEIRVPQPARKEQPERVTDAPRRLTMTTSRPFGWLFRPSTSRGTLSTADVESTPKAGSVRR